MARVKKSKKNDPSYRSGLSKRYPCQRILYQTIAANGGSGTAATLIDVGASLSGYNHRLYRQAKTYRVTLTMPVMGDDAGFAVYTLPDTWAMKNAHALALATREEQLAESSRPRGRWDDFRIGWSSDYQTGSPPKDGAGQTVVLDEAQISKVHDATASADYGFVAFGAARDATNGLYGILEQYDLTGNQLGQPSAGASDPYVNVHADAGLVEANADIALYQGDAPPYDADSFNGASDAGAVFHGMLGTSSQGSSKTSMTIDAPLGLIKVTHSLNVVQGVIVKVHPGNYKGVNAVDY